MHDTYVYNVLSLSIMIKVDIEEGENKMARTKKNEFKQRLAPYEKSTTKQSIWQLVNTIVPFVLLWFLAYQSLNISYILTFTLATIAAGFLVRIFIIFHDCCHHSFFKNRMANKIVGTCTGILTMCPYDQWQRSHSIHHATSGNLNKRGIGDIWVMTVEEYQDAPLWRKFAYRMYRNPFVMFVIGPVYIFLIAYRFNRKDARMKERINTYITNLAIIGITLLFFYMIGWKAFLLIQGPIFLLSGAAGVWLFYVQHQFEHVYFEREEKWSYVKAALEGSSYYKLPKVLQWLTGNIGFHHIHHLSPKVPNYYLEEVHDKHFANENIPTVTLASSVQTLKYKLWDEKNKELIGYHELKSLAKRKNQKTKYISTQIK